MLVAGCTNGSPEKDRDGDLVDDDVEREGRIIEIMTPMGLERRHVTSDPGKTDTDGDGLSDGDELLVRLTDPRDVDTDGDGLLDGADRVAPDDATRDAWRARGILEVDGMFLGELNACPAGGAQLRSNVASSDLPVADELLDGEELRGWEVVVRGSARHVTSDPCVPDTDKDGLWDHDEKRLRTDPRNADTDGDGVNDFADGDPLWDLGLSFRDLDVTLDDASNASRVRILFHMATDSVDLVWPGNGTAVLDVPDAAAGGSLQVSVILSAEDLTTGRPLSLFADPRGAILVFEVLAGTVSGAPTDGDTLLFEGDDGSFRLTWSVARR